MKYKVGQIIYLLGKEKTSVFPSQVVEKVTRKNLEGEETSYIVKIPNKEKTEIELEKLNVEVFVSLDTLRETLLEEAKLSIGKIIESASSLSERNFTINDSIDSMGIQAKIKEKITEPLEVFNKIENGSEVGK
tara:strand:+ start:2129 stop:2527 length:399 start_codon:yes stop_codon:yes gene_type:complete